MTIQTPDSFCEAGDFDDHDGVFVYQSCSGMMQDGGTFGGRIELVPGELDAPESGDTFELSVPAFPLEIPEFIY